MQIIWECYQARVSTCQFGTDLDKEMGLMPVSELAACLFLISLDSPESPDPLRPTVINPKTRTASNHLPLLYLLCSALLLLSPRARLPQPAALCFLLAVVVYLLSPEGRWPHVCRLYQQPLIVLQAGFSLSSIALTLKASSLHSFPSKHPKWYLALSLVQTLILLHSSTAETLVLSGSTNVCLLFTIYTHICIFMCEGISCMHCPQIIVIPI